MVQRFHPPELDLSTLPPIDLVLISHDHYDHLSRRVIQHFRGKKTEFIVPLGLSSYIVGWGIEPNKVTELDWWKTHAWRWLEVV